MLESFTEREKWIWLACFIDTDGSISLTYTRFPYYYPTIMFGQSKLPLLEEVMMNFNRVIYQDKEHRKSGTIEIKLFGLHIRPILESILPFLILKKRQAELCINYIDFVESKSSGEKGLD